MPILSRDLLRSVPLFELLDDDEAGELCQQLDQMNVLAGQMIYSAGDKGGTMLIVEAGRVELFVKDKSGDHVTLGYVEAGELFGELSLLDNDQRSSNAKALENCTLFVVDQNDLELLVKAHPHSALDMLAMVGKRIREADFVLWDRVVSRNPNEEMPPSRSFGERLSDFLTYLAGDIRFVYLSFVWFFVWIVLNTNIIPGMKPFDPFPFGLLTMVVSLEAIFLSLFVLISQNRQAARDKIRNDIEYEVNVKAELEIRDLHNKVEQMQELMLQHLAKVNAHLEISDNSK